MFVDYTPDQIGEIWSQPITPKSKGWYSLILVQPGSNDQVFVLQPCDWTFGRERTVAMVRAGVDPQDIRFVYRPSGDDRRGLALRPCAAALWWTPEEQDALVAAAIWVRHRIVVTREGADALTVTEVERALAHRGAHVRSTTPHPDGAIAVVDVLRADAASFAVKLDALPRVLTYETREIP